VIREHLERLWFRLSAATGAVAWLAFESWYRPLSWTFFLALAVAFVAVVHLLRVPGRE